MLHIFIDADACPVKPEVYRVAKRCGLEVTLVANTWMRIPAGDWLRLEVVGNDLDAADDWIADHVGPDDIVVTAHIPLAGRCDRQDARVISPTGKPFTQHNIGESVAMRDLMTELRSEGAITGGPPPLKPADRSQFLQQLDNIVQSIRRHPVKTPGAGDHDR